MQNLKITDKTKLSDIRPNEIILCTGDVEEFFERIKRDHLFASKITIPETFTMEILKPIVEKLAKGVSKSSIKADRTFFIFLEDFDKISKDKTKECLILEKFLKDKNVSILI